MSPLESFASRACVEPGCAGPPVAPPSGLIAGMCVELLLRHRRQEVDGTVGGRQAGRDILLAPDYNKPQI